MVASKFFYLLSAVVTTALAAIAPRPNLVSISPVGNIASVEGNTGINSDTRLYYQNSDGSITERGVTGPFTRNHTSSFQVLVPAGQAALGTNIVAVTVGTVLAEIHVYFISPSNVLSEYIWKNGVGWSGGPNCAQCIQSNNFVVTPGSKILYALSNPSFYELRVGYVSPGFPAGSLTEAVQSASGGPWVLGAL